MQSDGWSAQPVVIHPRFAADADLDPATGTPVGDEGYFLYVLTESANWDFSEATSLALSIWLRPWAHAWIILESPRNRIEVGHTGDFGLEKPRYHEGVMQRVRGDLIDRFCGRRVRWPIQMGKPKPPRSSGECRLPTTVSAMYEYVAADVRAVRREDLNCTDMVARPRRWGVST
jgi:hypothetical protein